MTVLAAPPVSFDMGRVISAGFGLLTRRAVPILLLALLLVFLPAAFVGWCTTQIAGPSAQLGAAPDLGATFRRLGIIECIAFLVAGVGWVFQGAVGLIAIDDAAGRDRGIGDVLGKLLVRAPLIFAVGVVATLAIFLGSILLVVPGILLSLAWMVCPMVAAIEGTGFMATFRRSAELTRGSRMALFGITFLFGLVAIVLSLILRLALGGSLLATGAALPPLLILVLQPALSAVMAAILSSVTSAAYLELRGVKEGLTAGGLAAVFD